MTQDVVLYESGDTLTKVEEDLLFEKVASHYLRLQEQRKGRKVRVSDAIEAVLAENPGEYNEDTVRSAVACSEFDEYLASRRKDHLVRSLVPSLYAAELGMQLAGQAADELARRLDSEVAVSEMSEKDLLAIMKTGLDFASKVDRSIEDTTGTQKVQVNLDLKGLLLGLPPDMAQSYMAEIGRRMIAGET